MRKFYILTVIACLFAGVASVNAQDGVIPQGRWMIAPQSSLSFLSTKTDGVDDRSTQFDVGVKGGYFFADNFTAGLDLGYSSFDQGDVSTNVFGAGVFARYYILSKIIVGAEYGLVKPKDVDASSALGFEAGYAYFFNEHISIEPTVNYNLGLGDNKLYDDQFGVMVGLGIYF